MIAHVDVRKFAEEIFTRANAPGVSYRNINIRETILSGFAEKDLGQDMRMRWVGVDDEEIPTVSYPKDFENYVVGLQAQRIRSFVIEYFGVYSSDEDGDTSSKDFLQS